MSKQTDSRAACLEVYELLKRRGLDTAESLQLCAFLSGMLSAMALRDTAESDSSAALVWDASRRKMRPFFEAGYNAVLVIYGPRADAEKGPVEP